MQHLRSLETLAIKSAWVTIGSFDGVHRGHQQIIQELVAHAHRAGVPAVVVTFYPHPAVILRGIEKPYYLTSPDERAALLGQLGVDTIVTLPFDRELAALEAIDFIRPLSTHLGMSSLWVGYDFALGRNRGGNVPALEQLGRELGYTLRVIPPVTTLQGGPVSSSQVRALLDAGNVTQAAALLGRWYDLPGQVVHGDGRGQGLGFPTANLYIWPQRLLPTAGVYATWAWVGQQRLPSVTNIGLRPTFANQAPEPRVEAHLLDYTADLYGKNIRLEFVEFLRPEQRFPGIPALLEQIGRDVTQSREVLSHVP
jgi:riboflavin kinase/FMN adenylyltransferase